MLFYYLAYFLLFIAQENAYAHENIVSISTVLGTQLLFDTEVLKQFNENADFSTITWSKGITNRKSLIYDSLTSSSSRFHIINRTKLFIAHTRLGDEGFYTLEIHHDENPSTEYLFHVILFSQNLSIVLSPLSSSSSSHYQAEQSINFTCSISFFANSEYIEQHRSSFLSTWSMIIYNTDPDQYQLLLSSSTSYTYIASLWNYELNRNDHNQTVSCVLLKQQSQQIVIHNQTLPQPLNITYKAFLRGNYYFTRSFNAYSSIEINCEEFNGNPPPVYTLIWISNNHNQTLFNQLKHGRYLIVNATWRNRGTYICFGENDLNNRQPVHQSFRLNIWFHEHQFQSNKQFAISSMTFSTKSLSLKLIVVILIFLLACFLCLLSLYWFCLQMKSLIA